MNEEEKKKAAHYPLIHTTLCDAGPKRDDKRVKISVIALWNLGDDLMKQRVVQTVLERLERWVPQSEGTQEAPRTSIIIDEAHLAMPNIGPGAGATGVVQRLLKLRRSNGVVLVMGTQNPMDLNKKVRDMARVSIIGSGIDRPKVKSILGFLPKTQPKPSTDAAAKAQSEAVAAKQAVTNAKAEDVTERERKAATAARKAALAAKKAFAVTNPTLTEAGDKAVRAKKYSEAIELFEKAMRDCQNAGFSADDPRFWPSQITERTFVLSVSVNEKEEEKEPSDEQPAPAPPPQSSASGDEADDDDDDLPSPTVKPEEKNKYPNGFSTFKFDDVIRLHEDSGKGWTVSGWHEKEDHEFRIALDTYDKVFAKAEGTPKKGPKRAERRPLGLPPRIRSRRAPALRLPRTERVRSARSHRNAEPGARPRGRANHERAGSNNPVISTPSRSTRLTIFTHKTTQKDRHVRR